MNNITIESIKQTCLSEITSRKLNEAVKSIYHLCDDEFTYDEDNLPYECHIARICIGEHLERVEMLWCPDDWTAGVSWDTGVKIPCVWTFARSPIDALKRVFGIEGSKVILVATFNPHDPENIKKLKALFSQGDIKEPERQKTVKPMDGNRIPLPSWRGNTTRNQR